MAMRHNYRQILSYNPVKKEVLVYRPLGEDVIFRPRIYLETFYEVWGLSDHTNEIVLGLSLTNDLFQLSPAEYGTYIKEDWYSGQDINKGSVLAAISRYKLKHNLPFDEY